MKKLNRKIALLATAALVALPVGMAQAAPSLTLNNETVTLKPPLLVQKQHTYLPLRSLSTEMGFRVGYDSAARTVTLIRPNTKIVLKMGSRSANVNGKIMSLNEAPFTRNGTTYVPLRFISQVSGAKVAWDAKTSAVKIDDRSGYRFTVGSNHAVWLSDSGKGLYVSNTPEMKPLLIPGVDASGMRKKEMSVASIDADSFILTVGGEYAAAMQIKVQHKQFLINRDRVSESASFDYSGAYPVSQYRPASLPVQDYYLTDGKNVRTIAADGSVKKAYDLNKITKQNGSFLVESVTSRYILARSADTLQLYLIDRQNDRSVLLYKQLLPAAEQKIWDENTGDVGDSVAIDALIKFQKQVGNKLYFTYKSRLTDKSGTLSYDL